MQTTKLYQNWSYYIIYIAQFNITKTNSNVHASYTVTAYNSSLIFRDKINNLSCPSNEWCNGLQTNYLMVLSDLFSICLARRSIILLDIVFESMFFKLKLTFLMRLEMIYTPCNRHIRSQISWPNFVLVKTHNLRTYKWLKNIHWWESCV